jgi:microcystin-dependent protein
LQSEASLKDPSTGTLNKKGIFANGEDIVKIQSPIVIIGTTDVINSGDTVFIDSNGVVVNGGLKSNSTMIVSGTGKTAFTLPDTTTTTGLTIGADTNIYRSAANILKTDDALTVVDTLTLEKTGKTALSLSDTTTTTGLTIGSDTNLYRSAADTLKTDDSLVVTGSLTVGTTVIYGVPAGSVQAYLGAYNNIPTGWLFCDGSAVSRTTYATLFAAIGTTFGAGNGTTTFTLPNLFGHMLVGGTSTTTPGTASQTGSADSYLNATWDHNHVHSHVTDPAAVTSAATTLFQTQVTVTGSTSVAASAHTHSVNVAATTSDTDSTAMSVSPTQKRTRVNYIIKT